MEAPETKSLAEQGRQYIDQLEEEGQFFYEQEKNEKEKVQNFFKKLLDENDDDINDPKNCAPC